MKSLFKESHNRNLLLTLVSMNGARDSGTGIGIKMSRGDKEEWYKAHFCFCHYMWHCMHLVTWFCMKKSF